MILVKNSIKPLSLISTIVTVLAMTSGCTSNTEVEPLTSSKSILNTPASDVDDLGLTLTGEKQVEYLRVKHHPVECVGFEVDHCLLTKNGNNEKWVRFYDQIEGFTYHWGVDYEILVEIQKIDTTLQDYANKYYSLLEILSETKQDAFTYKSLMPHERIMEVGNEYFSLLGNRDFICTSNSCADIRSVIDQQQNALLLFRPHTDLTKPLILDAVLCADSAMSFDESCTQESVTSTSL